MTRREHLEATIAIITAKLPDAKPDSDYDKQLRRLLRECMDELKVL